MSIPPNRSTVASIPPGRSPPRERHRRSPGPCHRRVDLAAAVCTVPSSWGAADRSSRAARRSRHPAAARSAIARPIPRLPPEMKSVLPASERAMEPPESAERPQGAPTGRLPGADRVGIWHTATLPHMFPAPPACAPAHAPPRSASCSWRAPPSPPTRSCRSRPSRGCSPSASHARPTARGRRPLRTRRRALPRHRDAPALPAHPRHLEHVGHAPRANAVLSIGAGPIEVRGNRTGPGRMTPCSTCTARAASAASPCPAAPATSSSSRSPARAGTGSSPTPPIRALEHRRPSEARAQRREAHLLPARSTPPLGLAPQPEAGGLPRLQPQQEPHEGHARHVARLGRHLPRALLRAVDRRDGPQGLLRPAPHRRPGEPDHRERRDQQRARRASASRWAS